MAGAGAYRRPEPGHLHSHGHRAFRSDGVRTPAIVIGAEMMKETRQNRVVENIETGQRVSIPGLVAVRQEPQAARGFVFHTLEDATGW